MENTIEFYIADLKRFDAQANGFEFDSTISKGIFVSDGDKMVNLFDDYDERSVYGRSRFCGEYSDTFQYGTKVVLLNGTGFDDYAWVLNGEVYNGTLREIEDLVLSSECFYKDRRNIACRRLLETINLYEKHKLYKIIENDTKIEMERNKSRKVKVKR